MTRLLNGHGPKHACDSTRTRLYTSEFCKQYSFSPKAVCYLKEHSLRFSFLFFRFRLWRFLFISMFTSLQQPLFPFSRRVHHGHLFLQSKTRKFLPNICWYFIFERHFNIPTILLEISSRLQADSVLNNALLAELSHPVMAVKLIDSDSVLITKNLLIAT